MAAPPSPPSADSSSATAPKPSSSPVNASPAAFRAASASDGRDTSTSFGAAGFAVAPSTSRTSSTSASRDRV